MRYFLTIVLFVFTFASCTSDNPEKTSNSIDKNKEMELINHSYSNIEVVHTSHLSLDLNVDFDRKKISGVARHEINHGHSAKQIVFDINGLSIEKVTSGPIGDEQKVDFYIGEERPIFGAPLVVVLADYDRIINIYYSTDENALALDWLAPELTQGGKYPFLYTQGEAILTRSWIPIQDTPTNRFTYDAKITVPKGLMAVMSAENPTESNETGIYHFSMKQPISSYLLALAVGDLSYSKFSDRTGVYAETAMIDTVAKEFVDIPDMVVAAEKIYGAYSWNQYDVLVLPYSFPFGGMENPRLTFLTPTLIAGDKSLVTVVAHELAHSWSGNLVTNATWEDFWLNEGFTVYIEGRIMEEVKGKEVADMLFLIERQELEKTIQQMVADGEGKDTRLKLDLAHRNPDDGMTDVAYIKGALFLKTLESIVGRARFDIFLRNYFDTYKFSTITTEEFVAYLKTNLLEKYAIDFNYNEWIYEEGIPSNALPVSSQLIDKAQQLATDFKEKGILPQSIQLSDKMTQEWMAFIRAFGDSLSPDKMKQIDQILHFSNCGNSEIMCEWYLLGIRSNYLAIQNDLEAFLMKVGRRKYLEPLYEEIVASPAWFNWGKNIYEKARKHYHSVSYITIDKIFNG